MRFKQNIVSFTCRGHSTVGDGCLDVIDAISLEIGQCMFQQKALGFVLLTVQSFMAEMST